MAISGEQSFDELLKRLAQAKSLPNAARNSTGFIPKSTTAQLGLRDAVLESFRNSPDLDYKAIKAISRGQVVPAAGPTGFVGSVLNSAPAKVVLNGLNTIGIPMRMVNSGLREAIDALDDNPRTKGNWSEYWRQVKDPTYGFGRVVPMKGWGGRFVGFAGDLVTDPINWLTFGAAGMLRGAGRLGARGTFRAGVRESLEAAGRLGADGVGTATLRETLGVRTLAGSDGRLALAEEVRRLGGTANDVQRVASRGKIAIPPDIAEVMGLGEAGIYIAGTKVRLPGSGRLSNLMERGITGIRLGVLRHFPGKNLQELMTRRGVGVDSKRYRMLLAKGQLPEDEVMLGTAVLTSDARYRAAKAIAKDAAARRAVDYAADTDLQASRNTVYRVMENPSGVVASDAERRAADKANEYFAKSLGEMNRRFAQVDEGYVPAVLPNYVPHMLTDESVSAMGKSYANPKMEKLMTYLKVNVLDPYGSLKHRMITADTEFMGVPGSVHKGTIDGINEITRKEFGFNLFETDMVKIMNKYTETVARAAGTAEMMVALKDSKFLSYMNKVGMVDDEWLAASKVSLNGLTKSLDDAANAYVDKVEEAVGAMDQSFERGYLGQLVERTTREAQAGVAVLGKELGEPVSNLGFEGPLRSDVAALIDIDKQRLVLQEAKQKVDVKAAEFGMLFGAEGSELNVVHQIMVLEHQKLTEAFDSAQAKLFALRKKVEDYATTGKLEIAADRRAATAALQAARDAAKQYSSTLRDYQFWSDDFGNWMQDALKRIGTEVEDVTYDPVTGKILEKTKMKVTPKMLMPEGISKKTETILKKIVSAEERGVIPKTAGFDENWLSATFGDSAIPTTSKQLLFETAPQLIGEPARANAITSGVVSDGIVRGMSAADNAEQLSDSFGWMTIRLLKEAERRGGIEAREALAVQLRDGVGGIGQSWQRAKQQMDILQSVRDTISLVAKKKSDVAGKMFGKEAVDASETIATLTREIREANDEIMKLNEAAGGNSGVAVRSMLNDIEDFASATFVSNDSLTEDALDSYIERASVLMDTMVSERIVSDDDIFGMRTLIQSQLRDIWANGGLKRRNFAAFNTQFRDELGAFVDAYAVKNTGKQNQAVLAKAQRLLKENVEKQAKIDAILSSKNGTNDYVKYTVAALSGDLRNQIAAVAETMQEYFIFNEAYFWYSSFQRIAPRGVAVPESVWSVLVANVSREQLERTQTAIDETMRGHEILRDIQQRVVGRLPKPEQANALAVEVASLPAEQRNLVERVFGTLVSGEEYKMLSDLDRIATMDSRFIQMRSEVGDIISGRVGGTTRVRGNRAAVGVAQFKSRSPRIELSDVLQRINETKSPADLNTYLRKLVEDGYLATQEYSNYEATIAAISRDAKVRQSEIIRRLKESGAKPKSKRELKSEIRGDEFGLSGLFAQATKSRKNGTGPLVSEWFARAIGGGRTEDEARALGSRVYTGVGGKYKTTGTFAINQYANSGDVFMGSTFGEVYKTDQFGNYVLDKYGNRVLEQSMSGDVDAALPKQYKYITEDESHFGIAYRRLSNRRAALRRLSEDATVSQDVAVSRLPDGSLVDANGNRIAARPETEGILGPMGYVLALEGNIDETKESIKQFRLNDLTPKKIKELESGFLTVKKNASAEEKASAALRAADYELFRSSRNPEHIDWMHKKLLGEPTGPMPEGLPQAVKDAGDALDEARKAQEAIQAKHSYLTSVDRRSLHKFIGHLAGYNLGHDFDSGQGGLRELSLRAKSPQGLQNRIYTNSDFATVKNFASRVNERLGTSNVPPVFELIPVKRVQFVPEQVVQMLSSTRNDYAFVKNNQRFSNEMVAAFLSADRNANLPPQQLALVRQAIDDKTVDVYSLDVGRVANNDVFNPENTLIQIVTGDGQQFFHNSQDALGYAPAAKDLNMFPTMVVDGKPVPIVFDELEWIQLFAKPKDVRQVRNQIASKEAQRKALWAKTFANNLEKNEPKLAALDAEIEELKIQVVRNDGTKQMEMVKRARAMRDYFDKPEVKRALGLRDRDSAEKAFEKWADLNAGNFSVRDTPEFVAERVKELDGAWSSSYEAEILSQHRKALTAGKDAASVLKTALYGGRASELVTQLDTLQKAHARYLEKAGRSVQDALVQLEKYAIDIVSESGGTASRNAAVKLNTTVEKLSDLLRDPARRTPAVDKVMSEYISEVNKVIRDAGLIDADIFGPAGLLLSKTGEEIVSGRVQGVYAEKIMEALEKRTAVARKRIEGMVGTSNRTVADKTALERANAEVAGAAGLAKQNLVYATFWDRSVRFEASESAAMVKNWEAAVKEAEVGEKLAQKELADFEAAVLAGRTTKKQGLEYVDAFFKAKKNTQRAADGLRKAIENFEVAQAKLDSMESAFNLRPFKRVEANEAWARANNLKKLGNSMKASVKKMAKDKLLNAEYDQFGESLNDLFAQLDAMASIPGETGEIAALRGVLVEVAEARANWLMRYQQVAETRAKIKLVEGMGKTLKDIGPLAYLNPAMGTTAGTTYVNELQKGWKAFGEQFPNLQADPRVLEIFANTNRLRDPEFARALQRFIGGYTKFFKAYAVATPGFHVRNSFSNGVMLIAAGGSPDSLGRGLSAYRTLVEALNNGATIEAHLATLTADEQLKVKIAYFAMMGSGGGLMSDVNLSTGSKLYSNAFTKKMQEYGIKADQHARFMLAYDGVESGMDGLTAMARVKRFMVDYEDTSTLDAYMRQIVPFWMWTSRNLPLQVQNIFLNPKAYRLYTAFSNNFRDEKETEKLPKYLREVGAFALPGGKTYFSPDFPFSRIGQQVEQLSSPKRIMADVNPLVRVPLEVLLSDKKFYSDIPFKKGMEPTSGFVGSLASYLGQPFGQGGVNADGQRVVSDKALYTLMNTVPFAGQFERLVPSTESYQARSVGQRLGQYFGSPVRPYTEKMRRQELERRLYEILKRQREKP